MSWNGIEIDMLALRNADSILVTKWSGTIATRVLIDGGNKNSAGTVRAFLAGRGVDYIDHILCSHPHDDHVNGLIELVQDETLAFGVGWMHVPQGHLSTFRIDNALRKAGHVKAARVMQESVSSAASLFDAFEQRNIPICEPFAGEAVGFLTVCGPTRSFYEELIADLTDAGKLQQLSNSWEQDELADLTENLLEALNLSKTAGATSLLTAPQTDPLNNSSTILGMMHDDETFLFTADAGVPALTEATSSYDLANLRWMQIPHHGSRRNVTKDLIEHFRPKTAFVSAEGSRKHPRRAVINAFKALGTRVYSTHYPHDGHLRHYSGTVPTRFGYSSALPLWDGAT